MYYYYGLMYLWMHITSSVSFSVHTYMHTYMCIIYIVLSHSDQDGGCPLTVRSLIFWVQTFSHSWIAQRSVWKSGCEGTGCEEVLASPVCAASSRASLLPFVSLQFFTLSLNHRCQMICQQTLHSPAAAARALLQLLHFLFVSSFALLLSPFVFGP